MKIQLTSDWLRNFIRTVIPSGIGIVLAHYLLRAAPGLSILWVKAHTFGLQGTITTAAVGAYYGAFRWLETKYRWASAFLGALPVGFLPKPPKVIVAKAVLETPTSERSVAGEETSLAAEEPPATVQNAVEIVE